MSTLHEFSESLAAAVETASKYVVAVQAGTRFGASGVVWQPGVAVTTRSTMRREEDLRITLNSGERVAATLAGDDPGTDIAVLRFEGEAPARGEEFADARPGHLALAVGRSNDTGPNAVFGIVSAIGKPWQTWQGGQLDQYIRLDINLYPGGSGAAVIDIHGRLIGMATGVLSRIAPLAIPAATIDRVTRELLARGSVSRAWLGVAVQPVAQGLLVVSADGDTPAAKGGLLVGDILLSIGGRDVRDPMELRSALSQHPAGASVAIAIVRGGEPKQMDVVLGERPARSK